jgi:uncharacterized protein involved in exopolysaccharide biosynthesis
MKKDMGSSTRDLLNIVFRRAYILLFLVIALPLAVLLACLIVNPIYESSGKVLVTGKRESTTLLQSPAESTTSQYVNLTVDELDINSEMELLLSLDLWERTVQRIGLAEFQSPEKGILDSLVERVDQLLSNLPGHTGAQPEKASDSYPPEVRQTAERLIKKVKVVAVPKSRVLEVSLKWWNPLQAKRILSTLLDLYPSYHSEVYSTPGAEQFFSNRGASYWDEMQKADAAVAEFKRKWNISAPDKQKAELIQFMKQIQDSLMDVHSSVAQYERMLAALRQGTVPTGQLAPTTQRTGENTVISVIATQLLRAQQKQQQATELFAPGSRDARMAEENVKDLMKTLVESLQVELGLMQLRRKTLEENLETNKSQLRLLEEKSEEARTLQIAATIAKERYLQYMAKEEEARMDVLKSKDKLVNVKVIERPFRPASPVFPKTWLFVLGAFFLAWPLGIGIILLANFFDHTFINVSELENATGYPVLVSLGKLGKVRE